MSNEHGNKNKTNKCVQILAYPPFLKIICRIFFSLMLRSFSSTHVPMLFVASWRLALDVEISYMSSSYIYICVCMYIYMGRWFFGCPAYQSGPGKDGFRIDISMASQSSFSRSVPAAYIYTYIDR